jgi:transcriptional regulator
MYVPAHFAMSSAETTELLSAITAVDLISTTAEGLTATFLPMLYDPQANSLLGHVARNNPHWRAATGQSLVIVHGADAYISPGYYASKAEHGRVVPTWNYVTAHIHGNLVVHDDVEWLRSLVSRLTARHEGQFDEPWAMSDAPGDYIEGQLRAIVGLELVIERIEAKAKLNQNRSAADQDGVRTALAAGTPAERAVAERMAMGNDGELRQHASGELLAGLREDR